MGTLTYSGDWERGVEMAERAMALNRIIPVGIGSFLLHALRKHDQALLVERINMPATFILTWLAAVYADLGRYAARDSIKDLLARAPDYATRTLRDGNNMACARSDIVEKLVEDLRIKPKFRTLLKQICP
jgi:hypothetical protein